MDSRPVPQGGSQPILPSAAEMRSLSDAAREARRRAKGHHQGQRSEDSDAQRQAFMTEKAPPQFAEISAQAVHRAAAQGERRVRVYSFPADYCRDRGRAINNDEPDWHRSVCGQAADVLAILDAEFCGKGYRIMAQIITWPEMMPGDVGLFLSWESGGL